MLKLGEMKKKILIIAICLVAVFTAGYTTYAATIKNIEKKSAAEELQAKKEKVAKSKVEQYRKFITDIPGSVFFVDKQILVSEIESMISTSSDMMRLVTVPKREIGDKSSVEEIYPEMVTMMKIQYLDMYFSRIKDSKIDIDLVHEVVIATSTKVIADMRMDLMEKYIKGFKRPNTIPVVQKTIQKKDLVKKNISVTSTFGQKQIKSKLTASVADSISATSSATSTDSDASIEESVLATTTATIITLEATSTDILATSTIDVVSEQTIEVSEETTEVVSTTTENQ